MQYTILAPAALECRVASPLQVESETVPLAWIGECHVFGQVRYVLEAKMNARGFGLCLGVSRL